MTSKFNQTQRDKDGFAANKHHYYVLKRAETTLQELGLISNEIGYWPSTIARHNPNENSGARIYEILTI